MSERLADNRELWLESRRKCITATDAAAILGLNVFSSPLLVWKDKLGLLQEKDQTDAMRLGIDLEPFIAQLWDRDHNNHAKAPMVQGDFVLHPAEPYFGCTPDYLIGDDAVLECKYAGLNAAQAFGDEYTDEVPDHYFLQVQWQLFVTGRKMGYLAVFAPSLAPRVQVYEIPRNQAIIDTVAAQCRKFWHENVLKESPPPMSGNRADTNHVNDSYDAPEESSAIRATFEIEESVTALKSAKEAESAAKLEVNRLENILKDVMGQRDADALMTDAGTFTWKEQGRTSIGIKDAKQFCKDHNLDPTKLDAYTKTSRYRVFRTPFGREG